MSQSTLAGASSRPVNIIGAGIAGSWQALTFAQAGYDVRLFERGDHRLRESAAYHAGGMLAPWCEAESAEPVIAKLGIRSLALWRERTDCASFEGSLVVALPRDRADQQRFAGRTSGHQHVDRAHLKALEPSLAERFDGALFFAQEGHVEPRTALAE